MRAQCLIEAEARWSHLLGSTSVSADPSESYSKQVNRPFIQHECTSPQASGGTDATCIRASPAVSSGVSIILGNIAAVSGRFAMHCTQVEGVQLCIRSKWRVSIQMVRPSVLESALTKTRVSATLRADNAAIRS